jgi:Tfp pilus assembly PilM family ATPase
VRSSLDFHQAQGGGAAAVERVVLTGAAAELPGFAAALEAELGLIVELRTVPGSRDDAFAGTRAVHASIAAGLAVEEVAR